MFILRGLNQIRQIGARKHEKTSYSKSTDKVMRNKRNIFYSAHLDGME